MRGSHNGRGTEPERTTPLALAAWLAILLVVGFLSLRGWGSFQPGAYQDDAVYLVLARSIAFGDTYGLINQPGPPGPAKYPFVFPLTLAPFVWAFPDNLVAATIVPLAATLVTISLLFWGWPLLSPGTSRWWGLAVASLYGLSPTVVGQTRQILSDPLFTTFTILALLLTEASVRRPLAQRRSAALLGIVLMLTLFTRWIGVVVCAAALIRIVTAQGRAAARTIALALASGCGALAVILILTPVDMSQLIPQRYFRELRDPPVRGSSGTALTPGLGVLAAYASAEVRPVVVPLGGGKREKDFSERLGIDQLPALLGWLLSAVLAWGGLQSLRRRLLAPTVLLFEIFYLAALAAWPSALGRLLVPVLPLFLFQLLVAVASGAQSIRWPWLGQRHTQPLSVVVLWSALAALSLAKSWRVDDSRHFTGDLSLGATWLATESPRDAIVATRYASTVYLYSQRKSVPLPQVGTAAELDRALQDAQASHLLVRPLVRWSFNSVRAFDDYALRFLLPAVTALESQGRLRVVYESDVREMVRVYEVAGAR